MRKLNLGCGKDIRAGYVNLDSARLSGVDVVHDLNTLPLPFPDGEFDEILAKDVLEHVDSVAVLRDLHRIMAPGALLHVQVPHFSSAANYVDPTHRVRFSIRTFDFFVRGAGHDRDYYFDFHFSRIAARRISFERGVLVYNRLVEPLVNSSARLQKYYELTAMVALFPAANIHVTLVK
jgi:ubiquinone/menaquinone biosynthesis C-methylase UbiE